MEEVAKMSLLLLVALLFLFGHMLKTSSESIDMKIKRW